MVSEEFAAKIAELEAVIEEKNGVIADLEKKVNDGATVAAAKIAELEAEIKALKADRGIKAKITKDDFVTMVKGNDTIDVHPASVTEHSRLGWEIKK